MSLLPRIIFIYLICNVSAYILTPLLMFTLLWVSGDDLEFIKDYIVDIIKNIEHKRIQIAFIIGSILFVIAERVI